MAEEEKQTWVVRYLLISDKSKLPSLFISKIDRGAAGGAARPAAMEKFRDFVLQKKLQVQFLTAEKL